MITVGLLGLGLMGREHLEAYEQLPHIKLKRIVDKNPQKLQDRMPPEVIISQEVEAVLNDRSIDVVDICLPTFMHAQVAIAAAMKGKHIFCEKPMALSPRECSRMIAAAEKKHVQLMIGQVLRFWPEYRVSKEIIDKGTFGRPLAFMGKRFVSYPNYSESHWLQEPALSGGAAFDLMIHDIDAVQWLFGYQKAESVCASGLYSKNGALDHICAVFHYSDGFQGYVEGGWLLPASFGFTMRFEIILEKGFIQYDLKGFDHPHRPGEKTTLLLYHDKEVIIPEFEKVSPVLAELRYFYECLETGKPITIIRPEEAMRSVFWALQLRKSALSGKKLKLL